MECAPGLAAFNERMSRALALVAATALALLAPSDRGGRGAPPAALFPAATLSGQWVWTRADAAALEASRQEHGAIVPAVLVASIEIDGRGRLVRRRRLSPSVAGGAEPVAVVVRLEDSLHRGWETDGLDAVTRALDRALGEVLSEVRATGVMPFEIQLDYDAPPRLLAAWSAALERLARGSLSGMVVWVTSIPSHLSDPDFGLRLHGVVDGHIIQLFDTGWPCTPGNVEQLQRQLARHHLAFRVGLGAFERRRQEHETDHAAWIGAVSALRRVPGHSGTWMFPGGQSTAEAFARLSRLPT